MAEITDWNYNSLNGSVMQLPSVASSVLRATGLGWHGPFKTKEDALAYYTANKNAHPDWKAPAGVIDNVKNAVQVEGDALTGGGVSAVTDPLGKFNLGGWFLRIGEILIGLVLVGVGLAKLTGTTNFIVNTAKSAAKVAAIA